MSRKTWNTVGKSARIEYEVKKSVFIADVAPVSTGEEATDFLRKIKKEFPDARHHVYAYRAGDETLEQRYSDDGEPSGTAGMPVLDVLLHKELDDVICVVTRYFGGIKLGTGGLVRAYTSSAKLALEAAGICSVQDVLKLTCEIDYSYLARFQKMASDTLAADSSAEDTAGSAAFVLGDISYGEKVQMELITLTENEESLRGLIANITSGSAKILSVSSGPEKV